MTALDCVGFMAQETARVSGKTTRALVLEAIAQGKRVRLGFAGESMTPLLAPGDEILVGPLPEALRRGDVVLFQSEASFVAHRVLGRCRLRAGPAVAVKGDHSLRRPDVLPCSALLGLVVARRRGASTLDLRSPIQRSVGALLALLSPWAVPLASRLPAPLRKGLRRFLFRLAGLRGGSGSGKMAFE